MICQTCGRDNCYDSRESKIDELVMNWLENRKNLKQEREEYKKWAKKKEFIESKIKFENQDRLIGPQPEQYERAVFGIRDILWYRCENMRYMRVSINEIRESLKRLFIEDRINCTDLQKMRVCAK